MDVVVEVGRFVVVVVGVIFVEVALVVCAFED